MAKIARSILWTAHGRRELECEGLFYFQVDLMLRCIYGIVHPDDQQEMKIILENTLNTSAVVTGNQVSFEQL